MRIILKELSDSGSILGETILCNGHEKGVDLWMGPDGLTLDGQVDAQVQSFLRASSVKVYNRKNHRITVSFRCTRSCASVEAAEAFIIQFYATCRRGTQLVIIPSPTTPAVTINNAAMPGVKLTHLGILVMADFQVIGGSIS